MKIKSYLTVNNHAAISMAIKKAAFGLIKVEEMPTEIKIYDHNRNW